MRLTQGRIGGTKHIYSMEVWKTPSWGIPNHIYSILRKKGEGEEKIRYYTPITRILSQGSIRGTPSNECKEEVEEEK